MTVDREIPRTSATCALREPAEISKLHDPALLRIDGHELLERPIERQHVAVARRHRANAIVQRHAHRAAEALAAALSLRVIDQDAAHHLRRHAEEVRAVLPDDALLADEPQVGLVNERRRLQRVLDPFAAEVGRGPPPELVVDHLHQVVARFQVTSDPRPAADR